MRICKNHDWAKRGSYSWPSRYKHDVLTSWANRPSSGTELRHSNSDLYQWIITNRIWENSKYKSSFEPQSCRAFKLPRLVLVFQLLDFSIARPTRSQSNINSIPHSSHNTSLTLLRGFYVAWKEKALTFPSAI